MRNARRIPRLQRHKRTKCDPVSFRFQKGSCALIEIGMLNDAEAGRAAIHKQLFVAAFSHSSHKRIEQHNIACTHGKMRFL